MTLPFCSHPVCLPVGFRLWAGRGSASPVELAGQLLQLLAGEFPDRTLHAVGDAAYHGRPLLQETEVSITTRLPVDAALYGLTPPRTGQRGRPALKGPKLRTPAQITTTATWRSVQVQAYGHTQTIRVTQVPAIWYGAFSNTPGPVVLATAPGSMKANDLALFTTDLDNPPEAIVTRYADRWSIETAIATGRQTLGVGQGRNRVPRAVERTVPFGFIIQSLVILWYATAGHQPEDLTARRAAEPWYRKKTEPAFEDMLAKLRRTIMAARLTSTTGQAPDPEIIRDYARACAAAAT